MFNSSNDRTGLCTFTFDDGRHCNMPHTQSDLRLCYFHEKREIQRRLTVDAGVNIARFLATNLHTACDLSNTFATLFRAGVQGHFDSKMVNSLTRLGHLLLKTHLLAKEEYLASYEDKWSDIVLQSMSFDPEFLRQCNQNSAPTLDTNAANSDNHSAPPDASVEILLEEPTMDMPFPKIATPEPLPPEQPKEEALQADSEIAEHANTAEQVIGPQREAEPDTVKKDRLRTETPIPSEPRHDDPGDPPDTGTHRPNPQPTYRQLLRYLRYLQRHSDQPQSHLTPCKMNRSNDPPVTPCKINRFFVSSVAVNENVTRHLALVGTPRGTPQRTQIPPYSLNRNSRS